MARGSCRCGAVGFEVRMPTLWCAHCHCTQCRRSHGAAFVTWFGIAEDQFRLDGDGATLRWYQSSPEAQRGFCSQCGTPMLFRSSRWPGEMHVALAVMDEPIDRAPQAHVFHDTHVDWMTLGDDLPRKP